MDSSVLLTLREFYEWSGLPAAIVSDGCRFENSAFASFFGSSVQKDEFVEKVLAKNSSGYEIIDDKIVSVNVISYDGVSVIEIFDKSPIEAVMRSPGVNRYLICFFSRLRTCVHSISIISDNLEKRLAEYAEKYEDIEQTFSSINSSLRDIISFILDPEQMIYLMDDNCAESVVCVSDAAAVLAKQFAEYQKDIEVRTDICENAMAKLNKSSFCVLVSDIAERLCSGEYKPGVMEFSVKDEDDGVKVRISADFTSKTLSECDAAGEKSFSKGFFFEYVSDLFCQRFGAVIENADDKTYQISFPKVSEDECRVSSMQKFDTGIERFSPMEVRFDKRTVFIPACS
ncbi:MAG: hypothetical protein ACI4I1_08575 [Oscillospiraceae bacterium]